MAHGPSTARRRNGPALGVACLTLAACLFPAVAYAQKASFVDAFIRFHSRLIGTFGDEGPEIAAAIEDMASSLAGWRREADRLEADLTTAPGSAPADLAVLHLDRGRLDAALSAMDAAIQAEPSRAAFHRLRGLIHDAAGRRDEAVAALTRAWELDRSDPIAAYLLADRRTSLDEAADIEPQLAALLDAYERTGAPEPGRAPAPFFQLSLVSDLAADTPIFSPVLYADGLALVAAGRYEEAVARFREAAARDPLIADSSARSGPMAEGIAALREGRIAAALEPLAAAVNARPRSAEAHRILGGALKASGEAMRSVEHLTAAVRLAPEDERALVGLGRALIDAGRHAEAERALRDAVRVLPASAEARWALADLYETAGRADEAIRELETAATFLVLAGKHDLYWRRAELCHRQQDYACVTEALAERVRLVANEAGAHKDLGLAYTRRGRPAQALLELVMTALLGMEDADTLAAIGQIHLDAGRLAEAEVVLQRAVAMQPDLSQARYALGTTLVRLGRAAEGKQHLAEFQRLRTEALEQQQRTFERDSPAAPPDRPVTETGR